MPLKNTLKTEQDRDNIIELQESEISDVAESVPSPFHIPAPATAVDDPSESIRTQDSGKSQSEGWNPATTFPPLYSYLKRTLDLLIIIISLPVYLPIMFVSAMAVRIESRGPIIFWQERIGKNGQRFRIAKFRSMRVDAKCRRPKFACDEEERITRTGHFLRKFHIDELPQLWNVLKGEMSLVGPRPEQPEFVQEFNQTIPLYQFRHIVKPGITGLAQITRGYTSDAEGTKEKLWFDLNYISRRSLGLDMKILFQTFISVISQTDNGKNLSYSEPGIERKGIYINLCPEHLRPRPVHQYWWRNSETAEIQIHDDKFYS